MYRKTVMSSTELLDVVDSNDVVIGQLERSEVYRRSLGFRVVNAFLVNDAKQVWIPRRSPEKELFPSCLDASVGGHVMAGETYENAFIRELAEELNIDAKTVHFKRIALLNPSQHNVSAHMHLYVIHSNETPAYNTNDFSHSYWFTLDELSQIIQSGEPSKDDLPALVEILKLFLLHSKA